MYDPVPSPLVLAIQNNQEETVEVILNLKASIVMEDDQKRSAIHHSARQGNPKILQKLLKKTDPSVVQKLKDA